MRRILSQLGEDVAYGHYGAGVPVTVRGVFLSPYRAAELGVVGVTGTDPVFSAMATDLVDVAQNDTINRAGTLYRVKAVRPDVPSGIVHLELKRA